MATAGLLTPAQLIGAVPLPPLMKAGTLRLAAERLQFTTADGTQLLDAPVNELHSVVLSATGFHVWHGDRLLRFAIRRGEMGVASPETVVAALQAVVGSAPAGVRVRRPWPLGAWVACLMVAVAAILGLVVALNGLGQ